MNFNSTRQIRFTTYFDFENKKARNQQKLLKTKQNWENNFKLPSFN